ncbi:putative mitochondrial adenine nucleotide transporter BTL1 [Hibiscus syriacus]|uniref:Mitochondrial adenine nucleotide transporter BTL1 n=1 Tax=Hibiscus syriacus TaxID=106335 RepID=A0A6A2WJJ6_HIBSY|nr:putative mitochondrial adenine nucleotide transporter BTL1 [Hibiscus syriacus]
MHALAVIQEFLRTREVGVWTRMVVGVGSKNITGSFMEIIEQQGWHGLWAGNGINMVRIIPTQAIELAKFECVKRTMTSAQEKWNETDKPKLQIDNFNVNFSLSWISPSSLAGAAAGIVSTLACHPLEVIKDRLTVSPDIYPSLSIAICKIYKDGRVGALYSGFTASNISFPLEVSRSCQKTANGRSFTEGGVLAV